MKLDARSISLGVLLAVVSILGCASTWRYKHYTLDIQALPEPNKGFLRDVEAAGDMDLTKCLPTAQSKAPCNVLFEAEYFKLKADYLAMEKRLIACEQKQ